MTFLFLELFFFKFTQRVDYGYIAAIPVVNISTVLSHIPRAFNVAVIFPIPSSIHVTIPDKNHQTSTD